MLSETDFNTVNNFLIVHRAHHLSRHIRISIRRTKTKDDRITKDYNIANNDDYETRFEVLVSRPRRVSERSAQEFVMEKMYWIQNSISKMVKAQRDKKLSGENTTSNLSLKNIKHDKVEKTLLYKAAREYVSEHVATIAKHYNVSCNRISIRDTSTRWGSASAKGNLNFSYKIILLPTHLRQYIIVHEVCHLLEMNHSDKFWHQVAKTLPHHKELRKELRKY